MRVLVRRPHAYAFKREHADASIPGLVVLDAGGRFVGGVALPAADAVARVVDLLRR